MRHRWLVLAMLAGVAVLALKSERIEKQRQERCEAAQAAYAQARAMGLEDPEDTTAEHPCNVCPGIGYDCEGVRS